MATKLHLKIRQGETFQRVIRWERPPFIYKPITEILRAAPVQLLVPDHGLVTGWRAAVVSANGMEEINAHTPPRDNEYKQVTVVDDNTIVLNDVNAADYSEYEGGGYLQFFTPVDLDGYSAEIDIRDRVGGTRLMTLGSLVAVDPQQRISLNNDAKTIIITIPDEDVDSAVLTWDRGVWDLEMTSPSGQMTTLFYGNVSVQKEVTLHDA